MAMHRKRLLLLPVLVVCFLLIAASLYLGHDNLTELPNLHLPLQHKNDPSPSAPSAASAAADSSTTAIAAVASSSAAKVNSKVNSKASSTLISVTTSATTSAIPSAAAKTGANIVSSPGANSVSSSPSTTILPASSLTPSSPSLQITNGAILSAARLSPYVQAILNPALTQPPRLLCPALNTTRYESLRQVNRRPGTPVDDAHIDYYFALDLRNCLDLLPRLMGSIVEAIRFLGPHRCALSIVEGNSPDGTADVLVALRPFLEQLGVSYYFTPSDIDPSKDQRIRRLAELRNLALKPLFDNRNRVSENTTVLFINDVAACADDILELAYQRRFLNAHMTCAMDWTFGGPDPTFYDVWVSRTIKGDTFFDIPNGSWDVALDLFWNAPETKARFDAHLPFQVFACWNGATAFTAAPLLEGVRFRDSYGDRGECFQGEPELFCKDLWFKGYGKIAVIPTVNLEYTNQKGAMIKELKGYTSDLVKNEIELDNRIAWALDAPEKVKCMPTFTDQTWRPWNESLHR